MAQGQQQQAHLWQFEENPSEEELKQLHESGNLRQKGGKYFFHDTTGNKSRQFKAKGKWITHDNSNLDRDYERVSHVGKHGHHAGGMAGQQGMGQQGMGQQGIGQQSMGQQGSSFGSESMGQQRGQQHEGIGSKQQQSSQSGSRSESGKVG